MKYVGYLFYWLIQITYGFIQFVVGFCMFIKYRKCRHEFYHGAILTYHDEDWGGISLGPFIFVNGNRYDYWIQDAKVHEYGHTIQSFVLGPLYFFVIGIPSSIWCNSKKWCEKRKSGEANYFDLYCESSANTLGALFTREPKPKKENTIEEILRRKRQNG